MRSTLPRTSLNNISSKLSTSVMWVLRKCCLSVCTTKVFIAYPSRWWACVESSAMRSGKKNRITHTGSGSATPIFFSHLSAVSLVTPNMRPKMLLSHSSTSPDLTIRVQIAVNQGPRRQSRLLPMVAGCSKKEVGFHPS